MYFQNSFLSFSVAFEWPLVAQLSSSMLHLQVLFLEHEDVFWKHTFPSGHRLAGLDNRGTGSDGRSWQVSQEAIFPCRADESHLHVPPLLWHVYRVWQSWIRTAAGAAPPVSSCSGAISAVHLHKASSVLGSAAQDNVKPGIIWLTWITQVSVMCWSVCAFLVHLLLVIWWAVDPLCGSYFSSILPWHLMEWYLGSSGATMTCQSPLQVRTTTKRNYINCQPTINSEIKECCTVMHLCSHTWCLPLGWVVCAIVIGFW